MKNHHDSIGVNRPGHVYYSFSFAKYIKKYKRLFPLLLIYVIILLVFETMSFLQMRSGS
jgi:hypothetical protein